MNSYLDMDDNFDSFNRDFNRKIRPRRKARRRQRKPINRRERITMYDYLASNVPADASFVINQYGRFEKARDERELAQQLKSFVNMYGDKAINALAKIHPDRKLLEENCEKCEMKKQEPIVPQMPFVQPQPQEFLNASGSGNDEQTKKITTNMLIIAGFTMMGIALIIKTKK